MLISPQYCIGDTRQEGAELLPVAVPLLCLLLRCPFPPFTSVPLVHLRDLFFWTRRRIARS